MLTHSFRLVLDRSPTDEEFDELADTCTDAGFETAGPGKDWTAAAEFDRAGSDLTVTIVSAIADVEQHGLRVLRVEPVDLLWWVDAVTRIGLPPEELDRHIIDSPVAAPKPMALKTSPQGSFYEWPEIVRWLDAHHIPHHYDATLAAVNTALEQTTDREPGRLTRTIRDLLNPVSAWQMPEWMEPYRSFIGEHGGNTVETLVHRLRHEDRLSQTNLPVFAMACMVQAQVHLLTRLHADGCLPPAPNGPGGW
jgi:hypothetical protein